MQIQEPLTIEDGCSDWITHPAGEHVRITNRWALTGP